MEKEKSGQLEVDWEEMDRMECFGSQERRSISPWNQEELRESSSENEGA